MGGVELLDALFGHDLAHALGQGFEGDRLDVVRQRIAKQSDNHEPKPAICRR